MHTEATDALNDDGKLLFGAGFVFGVMVSLVLLAVVIAVIASNGQSVPATVAAGIVFAGIVGGGLYLLAFPENRMQIPVDAADFGLDEE